MRLSISILSLFLVLNVATFTQDKYKDRDISANLEKTGAIEDRAGGAHTASNIGLFFENRGKLYPRRITQGPSGEFPINSGKHYIFRINQLVGIPGNVVQARYTNNEEWEAIGGYHNNELAKVAMSDNPETWHPVNGWPVKDKNGNPVIKSDQDSYVVYSDSNNSREILDLRIIQRGYTYGVESAKNIVFFKYDIVNASQKNYEELYFALYCDIDIGNISGGVPEYGDDLIEFNRDNNFLYFYDDGISTEWPENKTGMMGVTFLETPLVNGKRFGITDMHYNLYYDDEDQDTIQYGIMSSAASLKNSPLGKRYFHPGTANDIHFDDPSTIPAEGLDIVATISSGPYDLNSGDTLTFVTAIVAGETEEELYSSFEVARKITEFNFDFSKPPVNSELFGVAGDGKVNLFWTDDAESSFDNFSNEYDFEGYRIYKSSDNGINWQELAEFDIKNFIGNDVGLSYSFIDSNVTNGYEYWYSVTAYDRGNDLIESLESPKGNTIESKNLISVIPLSEAAGYNSVSAGSVSNTGTGVSNYEVKISPADINSLSENSYEISFGYKTQNISGRLNTISEVIILDSAKTTDTDYRVQFLGPASLEIVNMSTGDFLEPTPKAYRPGVKYKLNDGISVLLNENHPDSLEAYPIKGDRLMVRFVMNVVRNGLDTIVNNRQFNFDQIQTTSDGIGIQFLSPNLIKQQTRIGGTDLVEFDITIDNQSQIKDKEYFIKLLNPTGNPPATKIPVVITDQAGDTVHSDTLGNGESIIFGGLEALLSFNDDAPPTGINIFSVTTETEKRPTLLDKYQFGVSPSFISSEEVRNEISDIKVVPNPYIVSSLYEPEFGELRKEPLRQLQFINLPNDCTIYIFSLDADLVKTLRHDAVSGTEVWDLRGEGGREVAAGIYMYVVKSDYGEFKGRFAIIK